MIFSEACLKEVRDLHDFFARWLSGADEEEDAFDRFSAVMAAEFEMINPAGQRLALGPLADQLRSARGALRESRPPFRIEIHDGRVVAARGGLCLVTYEERQFVNGRPDRRLSSALFRERAGTPNGVEWVFLHEVWLERGDLALE